MPPVGIVKVIAGEWRAPILQHPLEAPVVKMVRDLVLGKIRRPSPEITASSRIARLLKTSRPSTLTLIARPSRSNSHGIHAAPGGQAHVDESLCSVRSCVGYHGACRKIAGVATTAMRMSPLLNLDRDHVLGDLLPQSNARVEALGDDVGETVVYL